MTDDILLDSDGAIARLTLNRPEARNALTGTDMISAFVEAIRTTERSDARVLIIAGAGEAFSAGGDVKQMADRAGMFSGDPYDLGEGYRETIQQLTRTLVNTDLVTIAAVNGPAIGAGFDIALACDLRVGAPTARFAHTFIDLGILPGDGGAWLLTRVVGSQRAAELAFTARMIDAATAVDYGILLSVENDVRSAADALAATIAARPAHSLRMTKRLLRHAGTADLEMFLDLTAAMQAIAHTTDDHRRAVDDYVRRLEGR